MSTEAVAPMETPAQRGRPFVVDEVFAFGKGGERRFVDLFALHGRQRRTGIGQSGTRRIVAVVFERFIITFHPSRERHAAHIPEIQGLHEFCRQGVHRAVHQRVAEGTLRRCFRRHSAVGRLAVAGVVLHVGKRIPLEECFRLAEIVVAVVPDHCVVLIPPADILDGIGARIHRAALKARVVTVKIDFVCRINGKRQAGTDVARIAFRRRMAGELAVRRTQPRTLTVNVAAAQLQARHVLIERHTERHTDPGLISVLVIFEEGLPVNFDGAGKLVVVLLRDDVDHTAHGVRPPHRRSRPAEDFNAFNRTGRRHDDACRIKAVVDHAVGGVHPTPVHHHERVRGTKAADGNLRVAHLGFGDVHARHITHGLTEVRDGFRHQFFMGDDGNTRRSFRRVLFIAGRRDNDGASRHRFLHGQRAGRESKKRQCRREHLRGTRNVHRDFLWE